MVQVNPRPQQPRIHPTTANLLNTCLHSPPPPISPPPHAPRHPATLLAGTACGHFNEDMFDNELMTGFVTNVSWPVLKAASCFNALLGASLCFPVDLLLSSKNGWQPQLFRSTTAKTAGTHHSESKGMHENASCSICCDRSCLDPCPPTPPHAQHMSITPGGNAAVEADLRVARGHRLCGSAC